MNKELLEKMQWLYEQGFQPDMWIRDYSTTYGIEGLSIYQRESLFDEPMPYFTESCLWSLLPDKIILDDTLFFLKLNSYIMYEPTYFTIDEKAGKPPMACLYIQEVKGTLHSALLDLTIWAVKEGYLKAEVKG